MRDIVELQDLKRSLQYRDRWTRYIGVALCALALGVSGLSLIAAAEPGVVEGPFTGQGSTVGGMPGDGDVIPRPPTYTIGTIPSVGFYAGLAQLSSDVYARDPASGLTDKRVLGSQYLAVSANVGFYQGSGMVAQLYYDHANNVAVIAFAGTECGTKPDSKVDCLKDLGSDADLRDSGKLPILMDAINFATKAKAAANAAGFTNVVLTGHSLGGALALYASAKFGLQAITFNSAPLRISGERLEFIGGVINSEWANNINFRNRLDPLSNLFFGSITDSELSWGQNIWFDNGVGVLSAHSMTTVATYFKFLSVAEKTNDHVPTCSASSIDLICNGAQSGTVFFHSRKFDDPISFDTARSISTNVDNAMGIYLYMPSILNGSIQSEGKVTLKIGHGISTSGVYAAGIFVEAEAGKLALENSAPIATSGDLSAGIYVRNGYSAYYDGTKTLKTGASVTIDNKSVISTKGGSAPSILVETGSDQHLEIRNSGALSTLGEFSGGIQVNPIVYYIPSSSLGVPSTQTWNGTIVVSNAEAASIDTAGKGAAGISVNGELGRISIGNFGSIVTKGEGAYGMYSVGHGRIDVANAGSITTFGSGLAAMQGWGKGTDTTATVSLDNSGSIVTKGGKSRGIELNASASDAKINSSGSILLEGNNSVGISAWKEAGTSTINHSGTIKAIGADSYGMISAGNSSIKIESSGKVQGGSGDIPFSVQPLGYGRGHYFTGSAGVLLLGGTHSISNWGTITALNDVAITSYEGAIRVFDYDEINKVDTPIDMMLPASNVTIDNLGEIRGAIRLGSGNDVLKNNGVLSGNVDLGGGANEFINGYYGNFHSSQVVNMGGSNVFKNEGTLSPGGMDVIQNTTVTGNFVQTATGKLQIDINPAAAIKNDHIGITGTAKLGGTVVPVLMGNLPATKSEYLIVTASGGASDAGVSTVPNKALVRDPEGGGAFRWFVYDTVGFDFAIDFRTATQVYLIAAPTLSAAEIASKAVATSGTIGNAAKNVQALGTTLEKLEAAGGATSSTILAAVRSQSSSTEAAKLLERLVPQQHGQTNGSITSTATFGNAMLSCASRDGDFAYVREGKCYYAKVTVRQLNRSATSSIAGITETGSDAMAGVQFDIGGSRRLGLAIGYEDLNASTFTALQKVGSSEGHRTQAGIVLKDQWGPLSAYFNLTGSYGQFDTTRSVAAAGFDFARSNQDVVAGAARLRLSYLIDKGHWYFKPMIDLGATYVHRRGYVERDAGAFNLAVGNSESWVFGVMPGFEAGGQIRSVDNTIWRPYVRTGVMFFNSQPDTVTAAFATAPSGVPGFSAVNTTDPYYAEFEAGLHIMPKSGINFRLNYEGRFGETLRQHSGSVKVSVPY